MTKRRIKKFWFQIVAVEKRFGGDVYRYSLCFKTISLNYAIRLFWLQFSGTGDNGRVKGIEIIAANQIKKYESPEIKRLRDGEYT